MKKLLCIIMDGIGLHSGRFGNAVAMAQTPSMEFLTQHGLYTSLNAHGHFVGLPGESDIGNSEVGHNAIGAGRIFDQGAKLVRSAIHSGQLFLGQAWKDIIENCLKQKSALHFIGLLSDGNVHSDEKHLHAMLKEAVRCGIRAIRLHVLLDGRDVAPCSAEIYIDRLSQVITALKETGADIRIASGGGRMLCTMDRYEADWEIVRRGWHAHVLGEGDSFSSPEEALQTYRKQGLTDQYIPPFVITEKGEAVGPVENGDSVILFNFRGDRAIQITKAFEEKEFPHFDRKRFPSVCFAGMTEYDGDLHIPGRFLVSPPLISETMGEYLSRKGIRQFACSETQKFGHVTYFWNGNRSGYFDKKTEEYLEISSDNLPFDQKPWMKAWEITEACLTRMKQGSFQFGRINFANGDMVGHTGNLEAAIIAVSTVDLMLRQLIRCADETKTLLMVTADHGNCEEMFLGEESKFPDWETPGGERPVARTSHTLSKVPFWVYDPSGFDKNLSLSQAPDLSLASVANTALDLMGVPLCEIYEPSLLLRH
ncbi:MAG: 2,3-bisphosphoglycerate-independent phosphoglycerate mutase [Deltaproteobacteria bacterium]|nr:2,3-bisphosphoglycerate-independent phosphoglycerate mutase [Deltaproteobacteria bacterium]